ncbi:hypothetical protein A1O3_02461 [Capronia epimyces CBS 606.96]|uniref:RBR-type E3 ubiquitin transferase n=1 Tax=Capronia epimyces CBS 606.96 TaxID=1182542 RepID=W9Z4I3_9EURO|nr:uncharacterized protein A1O3_02461 [Capronia epimyces CBS 606.96]EXJ89394.1 hypothetical protein A1O3_02461 [Capronia epimyces CBS 606.96]
MDNLPDYSMVCPICDNVIEGPYSTPCIQCARPYCYDCVRTCFRTALHDINSMPAKCCRAILHHEVARGILPDGEFETYKMKLDELGTINPLYCPVPTCSTFISPRMFDVDAAKVSCPTCSTVICTKCKQSLAATPTTPDGDHVCAKDLSRQAILDTFGYKTCPKCGTGIMKMFGCPHIRCQCGAHWCWACQRPITVCYENPCSDSDAYDAFQNGNDNGNDNDNDNENNNDNDGNRDDGDEVLRETMQGPAHLSTEEIPPTSHPTPPVAEEGTPEPSASVPPPAPDPAPASAPASVPASASRSEPSERASSRPVNLDDPDTADWEAMSLDFGEDPPDDEFWDIWGCSHRFEAFQQSQVPEFWLVGVDPAKDHDIQVECMACFTKVSVWEDEDEDGATTTEAKAVDGDRGSKSYSGQPAPAPKADTDNDKGKENEPRLPPSAADADPHPDSEKTRSAFRCEVCCVIFCAKCKRAAAARIDDAERATSET